jgi:hypothetical protein
MEMDLIQLVIVIALLGFLVWAILSYVPMPPVFQKLLVGAVVLFVALYLLQLSGLLGGLHSVRVG